jgi:hypothetical protein
MVLINSGSISSSDKDVTAARLALLRPACMVDYAIDIYKGLDGADSEKSSETVCHMEHDTTS